MTLEEKIAQILIKGKKTLAVAESCTGGLITHRLTNIPGSSKFLKVGLVTYSNEAKSKLLKVSKKALVNYGAVSSQTVEKMANSVRKIFGTDFGISISGIAGPSGGSKEKPVGLVYLAISTKTETQSIRCLFKGNRTSIKKQASTKTLKFLHTLLSQ